MLYSINPIVHVLNSPNYSLLLQYVILEKLVTYASMKVQSFWICTGLEQMVFLRIYLIMQKYAFQ